MTWYACEASCGWGSTPTEKHSTHSVQSAHTAHLIRTTALMSLPQ